MRDKNFSIDVGTSLFNRPLFRHKTQAQAPTHVVRLQSYLSVDRRFKTGLGEKTFGLCRVWQRPILSPVDQRFWRALMEVHRGKASVGFWGMAVLSIGCSVAFSEPIAGQARGDPAKARMQEMSRRELQLNNLGEYGRQPNDPKRSQAMMDQVSEDFQRILTLHNEIVRAIDANRSLSYQFISDATGEIRKRSARLQSSLKLQKPESATENRGTGTELNVLEMKDELILLCKQIESFVRNPIIEKPGTVDAQELGKARRDLQGIVELSDAIKKQVDKQKP